MGYVYGFAAFIAGVIPLFVFVFLGKTGFVIKTFGELGLVSIPEYFESRFSRGVRLLACIMMVTGGALNFGVFPVLDSTFLNIVTLDSESSDMARRVFTWAGVLNVARAVLPMFWGIAALVFFASKGPVPIQAMPRLLSAALPPGLLGLVVVGLLAGTMSTYAGYLIAWGSIISQDIVLGLTKRPCTERVRLRINRAAVLVLAVFVVWWGLWCVLSATLLNSAFLKC